MTVAFGILEGNGNPTHLGKTLLDQSYRCPSMLVVHIIGLNCTRSVGRDVRHNNTKQSDKRHNLKFSLTVPADFPKGDAIPRAMKFDLWGYTHVLLRRLWNSSRGSRQQH